LLAAAKKYKHLEELLRGTVFPITLKEELPDQWKEYIFVSIHKKGEETDCNNYHGTSLYWGLKV
jgi:hypothetical protein